MNNFPQRTSHTSHGVLVLFSMLTKRFPGFAFFSALIWLGMHPGSPNPILKYPGLRMLDGRCDPRLSFDLPQGLQQCCTHRIAHYVNIFRWTGT